MRVKQLWDYVPLPATIKLVWDRLTFSRLTSIYFVVALVHFLIQIIFQISALYINKDATHVIAHIAAANPDTPAGFAVLTKNGPLRACTGVPGSTVDTPCRVVWAGKVAPDAFGDYSYGNQTDDWSMTTSSASSSTLASTSAKPSTVSATTTIFVTASLRASSSVANVIAIQTVSTSSPASLASSSSSSVSASAPSASIAPVVSSSTFTSSIATSASATPLVPVGGSPLVPAGPARGKRMYIPAHVPGSGLHTFSRRALSLTPIFSASNGTFEGVRLNGLSAGGYGGSSNGGDEAFVSSVCVQTLQWPLQKLWNTQREDAVFIGFQFWVLGMSIVALLNESVPHIIAAFLTHLLATGWSVFQLVHTANFRSEFNRLTTRGACGGVNLLPTYWKARANAEIPILVLNVLVLIASAYVSWRLLKTFGWLTFKRVGASLDINRMYTTVLSLAIVLQLSFFFMVVSMILWIVALYSGPAAGQTSMSTLYKVIVTIQLVALIPWLVMGWYAVRREMRKTMIAFLALSALFIVAWGGMFVCQTWRLSFITWMFFRIISITAVLLTVLAFGLGIACWLNFGKDLPRHLHIAEQLDGSDFEPAQQLTYDPEKAEKVEFPAQNAYPTFSDAFPSRAGSIASDQSHSRSGSNASTESGVNMGVPQPRVVARPPAPQYFEVQRPESTVAGTGAEAGVGRRSIVSRSDSMASARTSSTGTISVHDPFEEDLVRVMSNNTYPTVRSVSSGRSVATDRSVDTVTVGMGKRWVIE
ncbi:hypothetical protein BDV93DRAFT_462753 [Ceratobasidium sp. AG-I]|nr:hypothetical protein BDV93DRAFT_462753 [Ceratobasidium sp. AG-I]